MLHSYALLTAVTAFLGFAHASDTITCNSTQSCPEDTPCCNQFGECGTGTYCLGGCHPAYSYSIDACMPMPVCKNLTTVFDDKSNILSVEDYLGNPDDSDWIYTGYLEDYDGANLLAMPNQTSGTIVSSTHYIWYGKVGATFKTSRGSGVVSAFIVFSNAQDEIDWEFVGYNLTEAEANYYYQGVLNYTNVKDYTVTDTFSNYHTYEVDWKEDRLEWYLDGELVRTLEKEDTYNKTSDTYSYPQTPSRVQFSLWPVTDSNAEGTIEWAGGKVDWDSEDIEDYGYFYFTLQNATIECYDPPSGTLVKGSNAYVFNSSSDFNEEYVMITDDSTELCDSDSSGLDNDEDGCSSSSSLSSSKSKSSSSSSSTKSKSGSHSSTLTSSGASSTSTSSSTSATTTLVSAQISEFFQYIGESASSSSNMGVAKASASILSLIAGFFSIVFLF